MMEQGRAALVIGVTGTPGSGKTELARIFAELGAEVIALDELGHELLTDARVKESIRAAFGDSVFQEDGTVSRQALGKLVFSEPEARIKLNGIVHPLMAAKVRKKVNEIRSNGAGGDVRVLVVEGALLMEMGLSALCDKVILVTAPRNLREERLENSRGWSAEELARREHAQLDDASRLERGIDIVVDNSSDKKELRRKAEELWREWIWQKRKSN